MGVGLVRSLQPPDILWIHWRVYNFIANTSKRLLFLPPSDAYVRSFLYLLYTLIKLYYTKALSDQASSLAPDWSLLLRGPRIPVSSRDSTTTFHNLDSILKSRDITLPTKVHLVKAMVFPVVMYVKVCWIMKTPGFLAPGGEEFNPGPGTRLDHSELLCN